MKLPTALFIIAVSILVLVGLNRLQDTTEGFSQKYYCEPAHPRGPGGQSGEVEARCVSYQDGMSVPGKEIHSSLDNCEKHCHVKKPIL